MRDAIVVGGGIVGASTAYHLGRNGVDTLLVDRRDAGRATDAGAGIVSPESSRHASEAWYEFAIEAAGYYPSLCETLQSDGVDDTGYGQPGVLVVDLPEHDEDSFTAARERVFERQARRGYPREDKLYAVTQAQAHELLPALGDIRGGFYYEDGARVNGRVFESALRSASQTHTVDTLDAAVDELRTRDGSITGVVANGQHYDCNSVVIAGGAWSAEFADQLRVEIPVEPQRGQIVHLHANAATETWPIVSTVAGHYLVPWPDGRVAAGATRETGSGFAPVPTAAGIRGVLDDALRTAPGIGDATLEEIRVGLRPLSGDGLPVVGSVPSIDGAYLATGHGPTGLTLGPYSGKCIAALLAHGSSPTDLAAFSPARFA